MGDMGKIIKDDLNYQWMVRDDSENEGCVQDMVGADINHEKKFLDELTKFASLNSTFVDIGAHVGYYSIRLSKYFEKVIAIEPSKYNCKALKVNSILNDIDNITILNIALGEKEELKEFYERGSVSVVKSILQDYEVGIDNKTIKDSLRIEICNTDKILKLNVSPISNCIVKIDTEGMELDILKGGKEFFRNHQTILLIEHHEDKIKGVKDKIIFYMKRLGYFEILQKLSEGEDKMMLSNIEKYKGLTGDD